MSADIIVLPTIRVERHDDDPPKNGALEAVKDYLNRVNPARVMARMFVDEFDELDALPDADHFLAWMCERGFKVVSVDD